MRKQIKILLFVITFIFSNGFFVNSVISHSGCNNWSNGPNCSYAPYTGQYTFVYEYGYYWTDSMYMRWNNTGANEIKNSGHRYTQDNTDGTSCSTEHFSATGNWGTNLLNPVYDRDNDTWYCNTTNEEAEITSNHNNFPVAGTNYWTSFQWTRPRLGSGHMYFTSQLSNWTWWMGEWNTTHYDLLLDQYYDSGNSIVNPPFNDNLNTEISSKANIQKVFEEKGNLYSYKISQTSPLSEVNFDVKLKIRTEKDLQNYLRDNKARTRLILKQKELQKIPVVITFQDFISQEELSILSQKYNIYISNFKARVLDEKGEKITIGGVASKRRINALKVFDEVLSRGKFVGKQFTFMGITSVEGNTSFKNLESLSSEPKIFIVDVLPAWIMMETKKEVESLNLLPGTPIDINVNDLYWEKEELFP